MLIPLARLPSTGTVVRYSVHPVLQTPRTITGIFIPEQQSQRRDYVPVYSTVPYRSAALLVHPYVPVPAASACPIFREQEHVSSRFTSTCICARHLQSLFSAILFPVLKSPQ